MKTTNKEFLDIHAKMSIIKTISLFKNNKLNKRKLYLLSYSELKSHLDNLIKEHNYNKKAV